MRKGTTISISVQIGKETIDLEIPVQVTIGRLRELLLETLDLLGVSISSSFQLIVANKPIKLNNSYRVADYPIGNGDQLLIKESKEEK